MLRDLAGVSGILCLDKPTKICVSTCGSTNQQEHGVPMQRQHLDVRVIIAIWLRSCLGIKTAFCEQAGMYSLYSYGINSPVF
jgi:hypothetical protein